jgi:rubrerythrin
MGYTEDAVKIALQNEEKGYNFYKNAAIKMKDKWARDLFTFLSGEEIKHIQAIKQFSKKDLKIETIKTNIDKIGTIFGKAMGDYQNKISGTQDEIASLQFALEFVTEGYNFYKEAAKKTTDKNAKKLFDFLTKEENIHYENIRKVYDYLDNTIAWYTKEEKWGVDGG